MIADLQPSDFPNIMSRRYICHVLDWKHDLGKGLKYTLRVEGIKFASVFLRMHLQRMPILIFQ